MRSIHAKNISPYTNYRDISRPTADHSSPMAGNAATPELVASVSNAGGLGFLAAGYLNGEEMRHAIKCIRALTQIPLALIFLYQNIMK